MIEMGRKSQERMTGKTYEQRVKIAKGTSGTFLSIDERFNQLKADTKRMMSNKFHDGVWGLNLWNRFKGLIRQEE